MRNMNIVIYIILCFASIFLAVASQYVEAAGFGDPFGIDWIAVSEIVFVLCLLAFGVYRVIVWLANKQEERRDYRQYFQCQKCGKAKLMFRINRGHICHDCAKGGKS